MSADERNEAECRIFPSVLDALPLAVTVYDKGGRMVYANRLAADLGGWESPEELMATPWAKVLERNIVRDEDGNDIEHGTPTTIERAARGERPGVRTVMQCNTVDKTIRWLEVESVPLLNGDVEYIAAFARDVTHRKSREDKLRFLVESAKLLSVTMDMRSRLQQKARLTIPSLADWCAIDLVREGEGIERAVLEHRDPEKIRYIHELQHRFPNEREPSVARVVRTGKAELYERITDEMIAANTKRPGEYEAVRKLGLTSLMVIPITSHNGTLGAITLAFAESGRTYTQADFDFMQEFGKHLAVVIDNARLYEELAKRDRSKDIFLAMLSHELRNPLAPIKNALELLKLRQTDEVAKEEIELIDRQFDHMTRLLSDLLDVARFTQGRIELERSRIELCDLVRHVAATQGDIITKKGIRFSVSLPSDSVWLDGDATRLEQALTNILQNAAKFTPSGGSIEVKVERDDDGACIEVCDTGIGIEQEDLKKIFDLYYQGHESGRASGLGIGLLLVREILRLHGGTVEAHSEGTGKGARFALHVPLASEPKSEEGRLPDALRPLTKKVLIVDDNRDAADSLARLLRALGSDARAVYSGRETLTILERFTPDVAILDITMPEMDGFEVVSELRSRGYTMPVVALTGHGLREDVERILKAGFNSHLTKPVGMQQLRGVLDQY